jgi:hypothetical protein
VVDDGTLEAVGDGLPLVQVFEGADVDIVPAGDDKTVDVDHVPQLQSPDLLLGERGGEGDQRMAPCA